MESLIVCKVLNDETFLKYWYLWIIHIYVILLDRLLILLASPFEIKTNFVWVSEQFHIFREYSANYVACCFSNREFFLSLKQTLEFTAPPSWFTSMLYYDHVESWIFLFTRIERKIETVEIYVNSHGQNNLFF